jgi:hypothetical protein
VSLSQDLYTKIAELTVKREYLVPPAWALPRDERAAMIHRDT